MKSNAQSNWIEKEGILLSALQTKDDMLAVKDKQIEDLKQTVIAINAVKDEQIEFLVDTVRSLEDEVTSIQDDTEKQRKKYLHKIGILEAKLAECIGADGVQKSGCE